MPSVITLPASLGRTLALTARASAATRRAVEMLSSGQRVVSASDDPARWFAAAGLRARAADFGTTIQGVSEARGVVRASLNAIESLGRLLDALTPRLQELVSARAAFRDADAAWVAAGAPTGGEIDDARTAAANRISDLTLSLWGSASDQALGILQDAGYGGRNLLLTDTAGTPITTTVDFNADGTTGLVITGPGAVDFTEHGGTAQRFDEALLALINGTGPASYVMNGADLTMTGVRVLRDWLRTSAASLSADLGVMTVRSRWTDTAVETLDRGAAMLTEADTNAAAAAVLSGQSRTMAAMQALSISSTAGRAFLDVIRPPAPRPSRG